MRRAPRSPSPRRARASYAPHYCFGFLLISFEYWEYSVPTLQRSRYVYVVSSVAVPSCLLSTSPGVDHTTLYSSVALFRSPSILSQLGSFGTSHTTWRLPVIFMSSVSFGAAIV